MKNISKKIELLAPAGNVERLEAALYFGADAVYLAGKKYGLRAFSDNFDDEQLKAAVKTVHDAKKKVYVTLNIFAYDEDFETLPDYIRYLDSLHVDAVLVSDPGVFSCVKKNAPSLPIHISTQSNVTNGYSAKFWADLGAERIVLARELSLDKIAAIRAALPKSISLEAFVHGAMCVSYSGRCLLSNHFTGRASNHGECAQPCRWEYSITETTRKNNPLIMQEDERGTYIMNSKDLNMLEHVKELAVAGVDSFKIEGRTKTAYYVANAVNAYRRAIDLYQKDPDGYVLPDELKAEPYKAAHRKYCTGFYFPSRETECADTSQPAADYAFCGLVLDYSGNVAVVEQRNRFRTGEVLEVLSPGEAFGKTFTVPVMKDENGDTVEDALLVQQKLYIETGLKLQKGDILRKKISK